MVIGIAVTENTGAPSDYINLRRGSNIIWMSNFGELTVGESEYSRTYHRIGVPIIARVSFVNQDINITRVSTNISIQHSKHALRKEPVAL